MNGSERRASYSFIGQGCLGEEIEIYPLSGLRGTTELSKSTKDFVSALERRQLVRFCSTLPFVKVKIGYGNPSLRRGATIRTEAENGDCFIKEH